MSLREFNVLVGTMDEVLGSGGRCEAVVDTLATLESGQLVVASINAFKLLAHYHRIGEEAVVVPLGRQFAPFRPAGSEKGVVGLVVELHWNFCK